MTPHDQPKNFISSYSPEGYVRVNSKYKKSMVEPVFAIYSTGDMQFSQGLVREFKLERFQYAVCDYKMSDNTLRITFNNTKELEGNYKLIPRGQRAMAIIGRNIMRDIGFYSEHMAGRYRFEFINRENSVMIVYLNQKTEGVT